VTRLKLPSKASIPFVAGALVIWAGALGGRFFGWAFLVGLVVVGVAVRRRSISFLLMAAAAGCLSGAASSAAEAGVVSAPIPEGPVSLVVRVNTDHRQGKYGSGWFLASPVAIERDGLWVGWSGPPLLVTHESEQRPAPGERLRVRGSLRADSGRARGDPYAGVIDARHLEPANSGVNPLFVAGNAFRRRVLEMIGTVRHPGAPLLAGFLVGETEGLSQLDLRSLRRAGLSHFVAVSGSNVALFLLGWWLALGPLASGPRRRAILGLVGVSLFVVVTRWEPSVLRASAMVAVVLIGRLLSVPFDSWSALGLGIGAALVFSGGLAVDVGFMLSAAATAGVLAGAGSLRGLLPAKVAELAGATVGAQVAVLPIALTVFGSVPLAAPIINLVAAPLVSAATTVGGVGAAIGIRPLVILGVHLAGAVLAIGRLAAGWPQLGGSEVAAIVLMGTLFRFRALRPYAALVLVAGVALSFHRQVIQLPLPAAVVLDVGQGDAILILGATGTAILIDGGPDPLILADRLAAYGVGRIDLMVATHRHADHTEGMLAVIGRMPIGTFWEPEYPHPADSWGGVSRAAAAVGLAIEAAPVGSTAWVGDIRLRVLGPERRYASINDQSIVLMVDAGGPSLLLSGDIEAIAQLELGVLPAAVLKVPHHGSATSDLDWLVATSGMGAVISVGDNDFGHPNPDVVETLRADGALARTDRDGDVVIPLLGDPLAFFPSAAFG
jgi:competence protein ComEC